MNIEQSIWNNMNKMNTQIKTAESKGQPLTIGEIEYALSVLRAINYRIRHSDRQEIGGKLTASYYIGQSIMNVSEYLTTQLPMNLAMKHSNAN